jgi:AcrR family transcriptional regulator
MTPEMSRAALSIVASALDSGLNVPVTTNAPETTAARTARDRARIELTEAIKLVGRRHLTEHGAAGLSLRAVAREVGMVSSAVYRYFPSRDDLLTALIIDAYDAVGAVAEAAEARSRDRATVSRLLDVCEAVRAWARANAHEYALIYGSPVPGYAAPEATVGPAGRVPFALLRLVVEGVERGDIAPGGPTSMPRALHSDLAQLRRVAAPGVPDNVLGRVFALWAQVLGNINLEMFGHLHNVIHDYDAFFTAQMRRACEFLVGR